MSGIKRLRDAGGPPVPASGAGHAATPPEPAKFQKYVSGIVSELQKNAVDLLRETRQRFTIDQLRDRLQVLHPQHRKLDSNVWSLLSTALSKNKALLVSQGLADPLRPSEIVTLFSYQAQHSNIHSVGDLLAFLAKYPVGVRRSEIADCYPGVSEDLSRLEREGKVLIVPNGPAELIFLKDPDCWFLTDPVIAGMWSQIKLPEVFREVEQVLIRTKASRITVFDIPSASDQASKKDKSRKGRKVIWQNVHLAGAANPTAQASPSPASSSAGKTTPSAAAAGRGHGLPSK